MVAWVGWVGGSMRVRELESERYFVSKKKKKIDGPIVVFENVAIGYFLFILVEIFFFFFIFCWTYSGV